MNNRFFRQTYTRVSLIKTSESGFTLVELMVVVAIIAILAAIGLPKMTAFIRTAETTEAVEQGGRIIKAVNGYRDSHPRLSAADIVAGVKKKNTLSVPAVPATNLTALIPQLSLADDSQFSYSIAIEEGTGGAVNSLAICVKAWKPNPADPNAFILYSSRAAVAAEWEGNVYRGKYIDTGVTAIAGGCCAADGAVVAACNG